MALSGRAPNKEEKEWIAAISELGCIVCLLEIETYTPSEIHHLDGKTKPDAHLKTLGLCYAHHRAGGDCALYTSRHPHKKRFEDRYGTEQELLEKTRERI